MKQKLALISGVLAISLLLPFLAPFKFSANLDSAERHQAFEQELSVRDAVYLGYPQIINAYNNSSNRLTVRDAVYGYGIYYDKMDYEPFNNDTTFALENDFLKASFSPEVVSTDYSLLMAFQQAAPYNIKNDQGDFVMNNVTMTPLSNHLSYFADMYERDNSVQAINRVGVSNLIARIKPGLSKTPTLVYLEDGQYREDFETKVYYDAQTGEIMFNSRDNDSTFLFVDNNQPVSEFVYFSDALYNKYYKDVSSKIYVNQIAPVVFNSTTVNKAIQVKDLIFKDQDMSLQIPTSYMNPIQRDVVELRTDLNSTYSPSADVTGIGQSIDIKLFGGTKVEVTEEDEVKDESVMNEITRFSAPLVYSMPLPEKEDDEEFYLYRNYEYIANGTEFIIREYYPVNDYDYQADNPTLSAAIYHPGNYVFVKSTKKLKTIIGPNGYVYEAPEKPEEPTDPENPGNPTDPDEPEEPEEPAPSELLIINNDNVNTYQIVNGDIYTFDKNHIIILDEVLRQVSSGNQFRASHNGVVVSVPHALLTLPHFMGDQFNYQVKSLADQSDFNGLRLRSDVYDFKLSNSQNLYLNTFPTTEKVSMTFDVNPNQIDNPEGLKYATIARNGEIYIEDISDYSKSAKTVRIEPKQTGKYVIIEEIVEGDSAPDDSDDETDDDYEYESNAVVIENINLPMYQGGDGNLYTKDKNNIYVNNDVLSQLTNNETLTTTHDEERLTVEIPNALLTDDFFKNKKFNFTVEEKPNQAGFDVFDLKSNIYRLNIFNTGDRYNGKFPAPVTLTFEVEPTSIDNPDGLRFIRLSQEGTLSINPIASYDASSKKVTIKTDSFSYYAIAEVDVVADVDPNEDPDDETPDKDNDASNEDDQANNGSNNEDGSTDDETPPGTSDDITDDSNQTNNDNNNGDESTDSTTTNNNNGTNSNPNSNANNSNSSGNVLNENNENGTNENGANENGSNDNIFGALPNTATLMYSFMAFGVLLIVSSSLLYIISRKNKKQAKN